MKSWKTHTHKRLDSVSLKWGLDPMVHCMIQAPNCCIAQAISFSTSIYMLDSDTEMNSRKDFGSAQTRSTLFLKKVSHKTNANGNASSSFEACRRPLKSIKVRQSVESVGEDKRKSTETLQRKWALRKKTLPPVTMLESPTPRAVVCDDDARENVDGNSRHLTGDTQCLDVWLLYSFVEDLHSFCSMSLQQKLSCLPVAVRSSTCLPVAEKSPKLLEENFLRIARSKHNWLQVQGWPSWPTWSFSWSH